MALARSVLTNLSQFQRVCFAGSSLVGGGHHGFVESRVGVVAGGLKWQRRGDKLLMNRCMATAGDKTGKEIDVAQAEDGNNKKSSKLVPRRRASRGLWRSNGSEFVPAFYEFFPSGLGNALLQATENINNLFENLNLSPTNPIGRFKEKDDCYKFWYEVPGLSKDDIKITIEDRVLTIKGEHKEEEEEKSDDEYYSAMSFRVYNTSVLLPDDAKVDEIKAELKDGVLHIIIPRTEKPKKEVKEIEIH